MKTLKWIGEKYYAYKYRRKIKNSEFSIICSNCIGGVIYKHLGREFLTPTINLWIRQDDFIKMCCDLKHYMELELEFIDTDAAYPVAKLGDITIHFNHDKDRYVAAEKWNRRKQRINYDRLYIILYYGDGITKRDIEKLNKIRCRNYVVFSPEVLEQNIGGGVFYFKPNGEDSLSMRGMDQNIWGIRTIERKFDFIDFLNQNI